MSEKVMTPEEMAAEVKRLASQLNTMGRNDLLFKAVGASLLEELKLEAAKTRLSRLVITEDYRFILADYQNREVELQPVHKAVYLLFLAHPEGIEFKRLGDYKDELTRYYMATAKTLDKEKVIEGVAHLVNPLDNAINEKCSRIKKVFLDMMDEYTASYYIISGHTKACCRVVQDMVRASKSDYFTERACGENLFQLRSPSYMWSPNIITA